MKKQFGEYVRIRKGFFGCSSFWRGNGHYLYIKGSGFVLPFSEEYYRFEMLKIQSVAATRTSRATYWSLICGLGSVLAALLAVASVNGVDGSPSDPVLYVLSAVFGLGALVCLVVIAINIVLGPSCVFRIETAVRSERIRPLSRWRAAQDQLERMRTEIELAQSEALRTAQAAPAANAPPVDAPVIPGAEETVEGGEATPTDHPPAP